MINSIQHHLNSLIHLIEQLDSNAYCHKSVYLSNASIGGHTRHIIEIFECLVNGYESGIVDYINRERNLEIESSKELAIVKMQKLVQAVKLKDKELRILCEDEQMDPSIRSTYYRELMYNIEHIIHHLALIKVTLVELKLDLVDENFGFAYSTIKYKNNQLKITA